MRKDILVLLITGFILINMYYNGAIIERLKSYKKQYQMIGVGMVGLLLFLFFRKNPKESNELLYCAGDLMKCLPLDKNTSSLLNPVIKTCKSYDKFVNPVGYYQGGMRGQMDPNMSYSNNNHRGTVKRSVSETRKKYVASNQGWKCGECGIQLDYTFEVDHVLSLKDGGTNDIENLVALCVSCHKKKTALSHLF